MQFSDRAFIVVKEEKKGGETSKNGSFRGIYLNCLDLFFPGD